MRVMTELIDEKNSRIEALQDELSIANELQEVQSKAALAIEEAMAKEQEKQEHELMKLRAQKGTHVPAMKSSYLLLESAGIGFVAWLIVAVVFLSAQMRPGCDVAWSEPTTWNRPS